MDVARERARVLPRTPSPDGSSLRVGRERTPGAKALCGTPASWTFGSREKSAPNLRSRCQVSGIGLKSSDNLTPDT